MLGRRKPEGLVFSGDTPVELVGGPLDGDCVTETRERLVVGHNGCKHLYERVVDRKQGVIVNRWHYQHRGLA